MRSVLLWSGVVAGAVMWAFVHFVIWPNLQIVLGLRPMARPRRAARQRVRSFARINLDPVHSRDLRRWLRRRTSIEACSTSGSDGSHRHRCGARRRRGAGEPDRYLAALLAPRACGAIWRHWPRSPQSSSRVVQIVQRAHDGGDPPAVVAGCAGDDGAWRERGASAGGRARRQRCGGIACRSRCARASIDASSLELGMEPAGGTAGARCYLDAAEASLVPAGAAGAWAAGAPDHDAIAVRRRGPMALPAVAGRFCWPCRHPEHRRACPQAGSVAQHAARAMPLRRCAMRRGRRWQRLAQCTCWNRPLCRPYSRWSWLSHICGLRSVWQIHCAGCGRRAPRAEFRGSGGPHAWPDLSGPERVRQQRGGDPQFSGVFAGAGLALAEPARAEPRILWRVENPFRFFTHPADTEMHRATFWRCAATSGSGRCCRPSASCPPRHDGQGWAATDVGAHVLERSAQPACCAGAKDYLQPALASGACSN